MKVRWRLVMSAVLPLLCGLWAAGPLTPRVANGQTVEEFEKLDAQCWELINAGRYADAEPLAERLLRWAKGPLSDQPFALSWACNTLGETYRHQARYAEAEPLYKQALAIRRKVLGAEHPDVVSSLNNLAELYRIQARYADAEAMHKHALEIYLKTLGEEHPDTAASLYNLALLYKNQSRYAESERLMKLVLEIDRPGARVTTRVLMRLLVDGLNTLADRATVTRGLFVEAKPSGAENPASDSPLQRDLPGR